MIQYLKLMRVKHYLKNFIVFLPLFFSGNLLNGEKLIMTILGFLAFSFVSSIIYIVNDIRDIDNDRKHAVKCKRPLASGKIKINNAIILAICLAISVLGLSICLFIMNKTAAFIFLIVYFILNILYSMGLKEKPIVDIVILSSGFILRLFYGGLLIDVIISNYLFLTVMCGAVFLAIGKRRNELRKNGDKTRKVLKYYNIDFLTLNFYLYLALTLVFFCFWAMSLANKYIVYVIPMIFVICLKYSLDIENEESYGDPVEVILSDYVLIVCVFLTVIAMAILLYVI